MNQYRYCIVCGERIHIEFHFTHEVHCRGIYRTGDEEDENTLDKIEDDCE